MNFNWRRTLEIGTSSFVLSHLVDQSLLSYFNISAPSISPNGVPILRAETNFFTTFAMPLFQAIAYPGILNHKKESLWWIPRSFTHLILGMGAVKNLVGTDTGRSGFTKEIEIAFLWTATRELLNRFLPERFSFLSLASDATLFALAQTCPPTGTEPIEPFSNVWYYKLSSSFFFYVTGDLISYFVPKNEEPLAQKVSHFFLQNLLFNLVRTKP